MSWFEVAKAVYDRAVADTGSGGLFYSSGNQVITGWYSNEGALNATLPYAVASSVSSPFTQVFSTTPKIIEVNFDVSVYHDKRVASAHTKHEAAVSRIESLLYRWQPTISGFTVSQVILDGKPVEAQPSDDTLLTVLTFRVYLST